METSPVVRRLNKIEGQVRGIARMIDEERYCIDVLHQVQAVKSALARVEDEILKDHANSCVEAAIRSGSKRAQREKFDELIDLMARVKR